MSFAAEVILNLRAVGYPYAISQAEVTSAGSVHTWPTLLATLSWLVDHIRVRQATPAVSKLAKNDKKQPFQTMPQLEKQTHQIFQNYLEQAYRSYLVNDIEQTQQLETALADAFERDDEFVLEQIGRASDWNGTLVETMKAQQRYLQE